MNDEAGRQQLLCRRLADSPSASAATAWSSPADRNPDNETYTVTTSSPGPARGPRSVSKSSRTKPARQPLGARRRSLRADRSRGRSGRRRGKLPLPFVLATSRENRRVRRTPARWPQSMAIRRPAGPSSFGESRNPFLALRFARNPSTTSRGSSDHRAAASGFRSAPRDHRALPVGAFVGRVFLAARPATSARRAKAGSRRHDCLLTLDVDHGLPRRSLEALARSAQAQTRRGAEQKALLDHFEWAVAGIAAVRTCSWPSWRASAAFSTAAIPAVCRSQKPTSPRETRILPRGNLLNETGRDRRRPRFPGSSAKLDTGGPARHASGSGQLDRFARKSADRARLREPAVARILRHRTVEDAGRSRLARRVADASGTAGLAGVRVHAPYRKRRGRARLGHAAT